MTNIPPPPPLSGMPSHGTPQPYGAPPPGGYGAPPPGGYGAPPPVPTRPGSGLAMASMIIGIVTLVSCFGGLLLGPLAVILGIVAGRKGGFEGKSITGIATGSLGFLIGLVFGFFMLMGFFAASEANDVLDRPIDDLIDIPDDVIVSSAPTAPYATEESVAASGYATAYEAYAAEMNPRGVWDGMYEGDAVDTPCFSFDGAVWWVIQGDAEICEPSHELWWETSSSDPYTIKLFGSGGVGAGISFEGVKDEVFERYGVTDLAGLANAIAERFLPGNGVEVTSINQTTVGGQPAYVLECVVTGIENYRYYVMQAPTAYDAAGGSEYFVATVYNESEWVNAWDDVTSRFENTFTWK